MKRTGLLSGKLRGDFEVKRPRPVAQRRPASIRMPFRKMANAILRA